MRIILRCNSIAFNVDYENTNEAVQAAIKQGISFKGADLNGADFTEVNLTKRRQNNAKFK